MVNELQIEIDNKDVEKKLKKLRHIHDGVPKAMMRAMNRTVDGMKTNADREIRARNVIKRADFIDKLTTSKARMTDLAAALRSRGRPIRLVKFNTKPNETFGAKKEQPGRSFRRAERKVNRGKDKGKRKSGGGGWNKGKKSVYARVKKTSSLKATGGFMATMVSTNGVTGAFKRTGKRMKVKRGRYKGTIRETIKQLHGPGAVQMLDNEVSRNNITANAAERFNKEIDHQVKYLLEKAKG